MISSSKRFHGHNSLRFVYRHGQVVRCPLFSIKYSINNRRANYRLAIVVNRKVNKSAVVRNKIRRRLYESIRDYEPQITKPYDLVITVFTDHIKDLEFSKLKQTVEHQLVEAEVIERPKSK